MQVSTTRMDQPSCIHNQRQVRVQKQSQRVKKKKCIEQHPLITRHVAGFYISDHAAWRRERTNAFTTQCWILKALATFLLSFSLFSFHVLCFNLKKSYVNITIQYLFHFWYFIWLFCPKDNKITKQRNYRYNYE